VIVLVNDGRRFILFFLFIFISAFSISPLTPKAALNHNFEKQVRPCFQFIVLLLSTAAEQ